MLKTNSKQVKENLKKYIIENFDCSGYNVVEPTEYGDICKCILDIMDSEKSHNEDYYPTKYDKFKSWAQGLPSVFDTCYYYDRSGKNDVMDILEQTEEQAKKYTEEQACELLTKLIYRELTNNANK